MRSTHPFLVPLALLVLGAATPRAHAAAPSPGETPWLSSHAGWTVYSVERSGRYRLYAKRAGSPAALLPAPPSPVTQDPGAGPGPTGRPTVVYQRCTGAACSIWAIDLERGTQRRVAGLGKVTRGARKATDDFDRGYETHPRIRGANVAFQTGAGKATLLRVGPSAAGRGTVRTLPDADADGLVTQVALGTAHVVRLYESDLCFGRGCTVLTLTGLASGRSQKLDDDIEGKSCIALFEDVRFDGTAFRWTTDRTAEDSSDSRCTPRVRHFRYDPRTGRTTGA